VKSSSNLSVSPEGWLSALTSPDHEVEIDFNHVPAFYRAQRGWYTEPPPFGQHLIYLVVKGTFRAQVQETGYEVGPGTLFWLSPWTAFRCWLPGERPVRFYRFRLRVVNPKGDLLRLQEAPLLIRNLDPTRRWFEELVRAVQQGGDDLRPWRMRAALTGLFAEVLSAGAEREPGGRLTFAQRQSLEEWVHRDGRGQLSPAQMARHLGLTADYFTRLFRQTYGIPPRRWLVKERIKMAAVRLQESRLNVGEVAEEFGYQDIFFFSRQFKQVMGKSPSSYRGGANP